MNAFRFDSFLFWVFGFSIRMFVSSILDICFCFVFCLLFHWDYWNSSPVRSLSGSFLQLHTHKVSIALSILLFRILRARLVHVFKNWKLLFKNFCGNTCGWKSVLKNVKCCLKTENYCLKTLTKHPLSFLYALFYPLIKTRLKIMNFTFKVWICLH